MQGWRSQFLETLSYSFQPPVDYLLINYLSVDFLIKHVAIIEKLHKFLDQSTPFLEIHLLLNYLDQFID